VSGRCP